jgi:hypothetical protein
MMTFRKITPPIKKINKSIFQKYIKKSPNVTAAQIPNLSKLFFRKLKIIHMQMTLNNHQTKNCLKIIRKSTPESIITPKSLVLKSIKKPSTHTTILRKISTIKRNQALLRVKTLNLTSKQNLS